MVFPTLNFSTLNFSRQQNIFRAPKNREASISLDRCRVNAKDMLLAKKKSSAIDRGIGTTFDFLNKKNRARLHSLLAGPRSSGRGSADTVPRSPLGSARRTRSGPDSSGGSSGCVSGGSSGCACAPVRAPPQRGSPSRPRRGHAESRPRSWRRLSRHSR